MALNLLVNLSRRMTLVVKVRNNICLLSKMYSFWSFITCIIFSTGVLCHPEFHWSCLFLSVGTDSESRNCTTEGTLQQPGSIGIREQNEDADSVASDTDEEHGLGLNGQPSSEASAHARFICIMLF